MKEATITLETNGGDVTFSVKHNLHLHGHDIAKVVNDWESITDRPDADHFCRYIKSTYKNRKIICEPVK